MPHVDKKSGELVIRLVYDGAPEAGKTTNIQQLTSLIALQRRGAAESPGTHGRRTEYFDWLDFSGGFIDGRRVRCQLVSVPGQPQLLHRRRYLLEAADAIVFVADSRVDRMEEGRKNLAMMRRVLESLDPKVPIGIIVQANKQDLSGALGAGELSRALELPPTIAVMPAAAALGDGVMQTFILATRLATDRVRTMLYEHTFSDLAMQHETPAALLEAMVKLEGAMPGGTTPLAAESEAKGALRPAPSDARRVNSCNPELKATLGPDLEVSAGHVWPPVKGRALLANAGLAALAIPEFLAPWAPSDAIELVAAGWTFHTAERWTFDDEARARLELLALVKRQLEWGELIPEGRALFLAGEGRRWRLWVLTARLETVREALVAALEQRDMGRVRRLWLRVEEFCKNHPRTQQSGASFAPGVDSLSLLTGKAAVLAVNEAGSSLAGAPGGLLDCLRGVANALAARDPRVSEWLESNGGLPHAG